MAAVRANLSGRQLALPGMEHLAPEEQTVSRPKHSSDISKRNQGKPVGMRGSASDRLYMDRTMPDRLARKRQNRERGESYVMRNEDEDEAGMAYGQHELAEEHGTHPRTGFPNKGEIETYPNSDTSWREGTHLHMDEGYVPDPLRFHHSAPSARRLVGKDTEVPLYSAYSDSFIGTAQPTVSAQRVHQQLEEPESAKSPRFHGTAIEELPHVYREREPLRPSGEIQDTHTVIDGNHRTAAHLLSGQMFMRSRVLEDADIPEVQSRTARLKKQISDARHNPNRNPRAEEMADEKYGGDWDHL